MRGGAKTGGHHQGGCTTISLWAGQVKIPTLTKDESEDKSELQALLRLDDLLRTQGFLLHDEAARDSAVRL